MDRFRSDRVRCATLHKQIIRKQAAVFNTSEAAAYDLFQDVWCALFSDVLSVSLRLCKPLLLVRGFASDPSTSRLLRLAHLDARKSVFGTCRCCTDVTLFASHRFRTPQTFSNSVGTLSRAEVMLPVVKALGEKLPGKSPAERARAHGPEHTPRGCWSPAPS